MRHVFLFVWFSLAAWSPAAIADERAFEHFETNVRPVLVRKCFKCHGGEKVSGKLRVDSREALLAGGENGPSLRAGDSAASLLIRALWHADDAPAGMPPDEKLPPAVIADFAAWIDAGAPWPATEPARGNGFRRMALGVSASRSPAIPAESIAGEANPIDRFLAARWKDAGIEPLAPADQRTLVRRRLFRSDRPAAVAGGRRGFLR